MYQNLIELEEHNVHQALELKIDLLFNTMQVFRFEQYRSRSAKGSDIIPGGRFS